MAEETMDFFLDVPQDLLEGILFRITPDDPVTLVRAALSCKSWCCLISDRDFHGRYIGFHRRAPPLLGSIYNDDKKTRHGSAGQTLPRFLRRSSSAAASPFFSPRAGAGPGAGSCRWRAVDCRHGRVLISSGCGGLVVWDPVSNEQRRLMSMSDDQLSSRRVGRAVLCAVDGCDHLACRGGPFLVVALGMRYGENNAIWASAYSSETGAWSAMATWYGTFFCFVKRSKPSVLIGDALYFTLDYGVLQYDLTRRRLSLIIDHPPAVLDTFPVITEDGGLGFVEASPHPDTAIYLWSKSKPQKQPVAHANANGWVQLEVAPPVFTGPDEVAAAALFSSAQFDRRLYPQVIGFAEGTDTIFVNMFTGVFAMELKSGKMRKIGILGSYGSIIFPYITFYTPDLAKGRLSLP